MSAQRWCHVGRSLIGMVCLIVFSAAVVADEKVATPFSGKALDGWQLKSAKDRSKWVVGRSSLHPKNPSQLAVEKAADAKQAELVNAQGSSVDIYTVDKFGDCTIELELMVPKGSNSGIYVMGEYEVQILDS